MIELIYGTKKNRGDFSNLIIGLNNKDYNFSNILVGKNRLRDSDKDGVPNIFDCKPNDPKRHGFADNVAKKIREIISPKKETTPPKVQTTPYAGSNLQKAVDKAPSTQKTTQQTPTPAAQTPAQKQASSNLGQAVTTTKKSGGGGMSGTALAMSTPSTPTPSAETLSGTTQQREQQIQTYQEQVKSGLLPQPTLTSGGSTYLTPQQKALEQFKELTTKGEIQGYSGKLLSDQQMAKQELLINAGLMKPEQRQEQYGTYNVAVTPEGEKALAKISQPKTLQEYATKEKPYEQVVAPGKAEANIYGINVEGIKRVGTDLISPVKGGIAVIGETYLNRNIVRNYLYERPQEKVIRKTGEKYLNKLATKEEKETFLVASAITGATFIPGIAEGIGLYFGIKGFEQIKKGFTETGAEGTYDIIMGGIQAAPLGVGLVKNIKYPYDKINKQTEMTRAIESAEVISKNKGTLRENILNKYDLSEQQKLEIKNLYDSGYTARKIELSLKADPRFKDITPDVKANIIELVDRQGNVGKRIAVGKIEAKIGGKRLNQDLLAESILKINEEGNVQAYTEVLNRIKQKPLIGIGDNVYPKSKSTLSRFYEESKLTGYKEKPKQRIVRTETESFLISKEKYTGGNLLTKYQIPENLAEYKKGSKPFSLSTDIEVQRLRETKGLKIKPKEERIIPSELAKKRKETIFIEATDKNIRDLNIAGTKNLIGGYKENPFSFNKDVKDLIIVRKGEGISEQSFQRKVLHELTHAETKNFFNKELESKLPYSQQPSELVAIEMEKLVNKKGEIELPGLKITSEGDTGFLLGQKFYDTRGVGVTKRIKEKIKNRPSEIRDIKLDKFRESLGKKEKSIFDKMDKIDKMFWMEQSKQGLGKYEDKGLSEIFSQEYIRQLEEAKIPKELTKREIVLKEEEKLIEGIYKLYEQEKTQKGKETILNAFRKNDMNLLGRKALEQAKKERIKYKQESQVLEKPFKKPAPSYVGGAGGELSMSDYAFVSGKSIFSNQIFKEQLIGIAGELSREIPKIEIGRGISLGYGMNTKQYNKTIQIPKNEERLFTSLSTSTRSSDLFNTGSKTEQKTFTVQTTGLITNLGIKETQKEKQKEEQLQRNVFETPRITKGSTPTIPLTFEFPYETPFPFMQEKGKVSREQGYNAEAYIQATKPKKSYWLKLNKQPLTKKSALSESAKFVDNTISARGRIVKAKSKQRPIDTGENYFGINRNKFRTYQKRKGVKSELPNSFIEKQKYRADSNNEVLALQIGKQEKRKSLNIKNIFGL